MHYSDYQTCAIRPHLNVSEWDIFSSLPTGLVILNAQGRIMWLNPAAEAMLGYGLIDSLWLNVIMRAFAPKDDDGHDLSLVDGRRVHVAISCLESLPGNLISLTDITATREYQKAQEQEKRLASIGTMTAQLAHQIRTPLASAMLYLEHLSINPRIDEHAKAAIKRIQDCHASIEQQIQDLLLFARGTSIKPEQIDMDNWCNQLNQRAQPFVLSHYAEFTIHNQLQQKQASIHAESLLGSVVNLIINSLQADAKEIHITLASMDNSGIQITIADNGCGMPEQVKTQALTPFFTTKAKGTGLGLAVVFAVVEAHGGSVHIESTAGIGTEVTLKITGKD